MNKRIQELWIRAGGTYDTGNQWSYPEYKIDSPDKFAELIVQECIDTIDDGVLNCDGEGVWFDGYVRGATECRRKIKHHFGVEE